MGVYDIIRKAISTEKGVDKRENHRTLCFEIAPDANKTQVKAAVEQLFKVKVEEVRTVTTAGKLRRRGKFTGYRADVKKAYVRLRPGQKVPEYSEI